MYEACAGSFRAVEQSPLKQRKSFTLTSFDYLWIFFDFFHLQGILNNLCQVFFVT